ncbi:MAG: hypothetical protein LN414_07975, partial [Candidatus Thermoplasmatota archaeon]|nr:hypothetical protein [Candidatus Thermoplasmatota archaeon]
MMVSMPALGEEPVYPDVVRCIIGMGHGVDADVVYIGEQGVNLRITFGQDCRDWTLEVKDPLFTTRHWGLHRVEVEAGKGIGTSLNLVPDVEPGTYDFIVYLNYSTDDGPVNSTYTFNLTIKRAWRVVDVHVPDGGDHRLSVTFETFVNFHNITVLFGGDGNVGVEDERIVLEDVEPGEHTVKTTAVRVDSMWGNAQEASWHLIGVVDNRTIEKMEYNVPVDVSWGVP